VDLKHDCAHEYFHATQNQYLTFGTMIMNRWWMEATADYAAAGLMGTGKFSFVDGNYLKTSMGTVNGVHEYQSARFVDYLVSKERVDFKKLWEYTVSATEIRKFLLAVRLLLLRRTGLPIGEEGFDVRSES